MYDFLRNISVCWSTFHVLVIFVFLYRSRFSPKKTVILTCIFMFPLVFLNTIISIFYGSKGISQAMLFSLTIPSLIFFWVLSADRGFRFLFTFCIVDTFSYWIILITSLLDHYIGNTGILMLAVRLVAFPLVEYFVWKYIRKPYIDIQESVAHGWGIFFMAGAIYYLLLIVSGSWPVLVYDRPQELPSFILILILMPITYLSIFLSLYNQLSVFKMKENEQNYKNQQATLQMQLENQNNIRKLNHDIKAYINTLSALLSEEKYDEAKQHISQITNITSTRQNFCSNPYINALLCHFYDRFKQKDMKLDISVLLLDNSALPHTDICLILSNALENSLEAASATDDRQTTVKLRQKGKYLLIRILNSCDNSLVIMQGHIPQTTKQEPGHGYGMQTIFQTAEKLNGSAVCSAENGIFTLDVCLKIL